MCRSSAYGFDRANRPIGHGHGVHLHVEGLWAIFGCMKVVFSGGEEVVVV